MGSASKFHSHSIPLWLWAWSWQPFKRSFKFVVSPAGNLLRRCETWKQTSQNTKCFTFGEFLVAYRASSGSAEGTARFRNEPMNVQACTISRAPYVRKVKSQDTSLLES